MADWTFVCNTSDVDFEDQYRFDHNGRTYCIYHLEDGFYATDGLCTHEDVHLVDGLIDGEEIECPMHLSLIHISEPTRLLSISYAVFCLKKKNKII